ncbi:MAG: hypothetical protein L6282_05910 [Candidatus Methanoperedenaceae archaeon]|nr:hypothetical protein [Candidatus Methanoperedenaceae archaeon]
MSIGLEYMDRLFSQQERLKTQRKRIMAQNTGTTGGTGREQVEKSRISAQTGRILSQREMEKERAAGSRARGEAVTGMDELEREKLSRQSRWRLKWDRRSTKWDARSRKFNRR